MTETIPLSGHVVLSADDIRRAVRRIAHEIVERNHGLSRVALVGMHTRGVPLAHRLADAIREFEGDSVPVGELDIGLYRDDIPSLQLKPRLQRTEMPVDIDGWRVVLVDDVLYTGRTIRAAIEALFDYGRPAAVRLAVLCDRGHRELPIRPDYVGKNLPTSRGERIQVQLVEVDEVDQVVLVPAPEEESH